MTWDKTGGLEARYTLNIYWETQFLPIVDRYYYHYFKDAKKHFDKLVASDEHGYTANIYDLKRDVRKAYHKVEFIND